MNYFTCKVGSNNFIKEKRKKTSSTPCLQSHCIQLQEKQKNKKTMKQNIYMMNLTLVLILLHLQNINIKI